ncbi:MAG: DUF4974 domain-containing protein [Tannerella sp.]|jgi:ferric-dicitrate binding protein FerR (iron transport regulator)|nr:DUF4974 domain-containing protein [Tannerella sp.]
MSKEKENIVREGASDNISAAVIGRYCLGKASKRDFKKVKRWLAADAGNEEILLQTGRIIIAAEHIKWRRKWDAEAAYRETVSKIRNKTRIVVIKRVLAAAACIAILLGGLVTGKMMMKSKEIPVNYVTITTNAGMRTTLLLPDSTEVTLNSSSKLIYPVIFAGDERRVVLEGEGYFDVFRDPERPFRVEAEGRAFEVEALGTTFNLQSYKNDLQLRTTLLSGSVRLHFTMPSGEKKRLTLTPSEKAIYDIATGDVVVNRVNALNETSWTYGRLIFNNTPMSEVLNRLSHYYNVAFEVKDSEIDGYSFTGTLIDRQLEQVLDYMAISSKIRSQVIKADKDDSFGIFKTKVILSLGKKR